MSPNKIESMLLFGVYLCMYVFFSMSRSSGFHWMNLSETLFSINIHSRLLYEIEEGKMLISFQRK